MRRHIDGVDAGVGVCIHLPHGDFHFRHRCRTRWIHVREYLAIATNERRVTQHSDIQVDVSRGVAGRVLNVESEQGRPRRRDRCAIVGPNDLVNAPCARPSDCSVAR